MRKRLLHTITLVLLAASAAGTTYTVDHSGGADFTSIQPAINAASAGDVVYVYPGTYAGPIVMKDGVNLYGFAPQTTTIDGQGTAAHVVAYNGASAAVLSGFRITGSQRPTAAGTWHYGGVYVAGGPLTIRNNIIQSNHAGIAVLEQGNPTIINNTIINNANGIILADRGYATQPAHELVVAIVFDKDEAVAAQFGQLLIAQDIGVDLIAVGAVAKTNMLAYDAIVLCDDTGSHGQWADEQAFNAIVQSGKPLLGVGEGGSAFFDDLRLATGWGKGAYAQHHSVLAVNTGNEIFKSPLPIAFPPQAPILQLYKADQTMIATYLPQVPSNVTVFGQLTGDNRYYPITLENGKYLMWGFRGSPSAMTQTGKDLFVNAVSLLMRRCYPGLPSPRISPTGSQLVVGTTLREYSIRMNNSSLYPAQLFDPAPYLPPCGLNTNSSRTWVDIYREDGGYLYGYCGAGIQTLLQNMLVRLPADQDPPRVYVKLTDRRCGIAYTSNTITLTVERPVTHTIMNNIITGSQQGIFYYNYGPDGRILYNDVWGNWTNYHNNAGGIPFAPEPGTGEISVRPMFADSDYRLADGSPCIDAGHPGLEYNDPDDTRNDMGVYGGPDATGLGTHSGSGFIFTSIGNVPTSDIQQNPAHPSHGLVSVSYPDAPFGASLYIHGLFGETDIANGVRFYQILVAPWDAVNDPPEPEDYQPIATGLSKVRYLPQTDGTVQTQVISLGPKTIGGVPNVYELTYEGWWSHIDRRMIWHTRGLPNGKYTLACKAYRWHPTLPGVLQEYFPTPNDLDHLDLLIDNSPVEVEIHSVKYDPASPHWNTLTDGEIPECGIINLQSDTENLRFNITARHPNGYLRSWVLDALWGKNNYAGVIAQASYPGVVPPNNWPGVTAQEYNSSAGALTPWQPCAYQFRLRAYTRATNGYGYLIATEYKYSDSFSDHYFIDLGSTCAWCGGADVNRDGTVNFEDLAIVAAHWLQSCGVECP
jgi:parallel beta-helix repeat protein